MVPYGTKCKVPNGTFSVISLMSMTDQSLADTASARSRDDDLADRFGHLALEMLNETELSDAWRLNFLANFFVGKAYRILEARFGISRPEFVVLYCLSQRPGLVAQEVCDVTGLPKNSISRAVLSLLNRQLIERAPSPKDGRAKSLIMTGSGRSLIDEIIPVFETRQSRMLAALEPDEQRDFRRLLMKLIDGLPEWVDADR